VLCSCTCVVRAKRDAHHTPPSSRQHTRYKQPNKRRCELACGRGRGSALRQQALSSFSDFHDRCTCRSRVAPLAGCACEVKLAQRGNSCWRVTNPAPWRLRQSGPDRRLWRHLCHSARSLSRRFFHRVVGTALMATRSATLRHAQSERRNDVCQLDSHHNLTPPALPPFCSFSRPLSFCPG
jgi:hypothetical protein